MENERTVRDGDVFTGGVEMSSQRCYWSTDVEFATVLVW